MRPQVSGLGWFGVLRGLGRAGLGLALAAGLSTCGPGHGTDCLKSTGTIITQRREVAPGLVTVTAFDNVDLRLVQDTQTYAEVRAGENLISDITLTRNGNALEINNTSTCNWARSYDTPREVTLHLPHIKNVFLRGQGNGSTVGQFAQDSLFVHLVGAGDYDLNLNATYLNIDQYELGDVTLSGTIAEMNFTVGGSGRLFAQGLALRRCYFNMTRDSDGDAHVRVTEALYGTVAGAGTLYYHFSGLPASIGINVTGKGGKKVE
ncbi:GIN domain-containing protein [Hymenobacter terricola]|uniref:GIN domain-containing protein n=1 Tax=Hymenobacter terricola TaxID=2819236 RepID=UPI001CF50EFF|nr:DUF2807 domain-containing protein [Hymenobacter terricola]